MVQLTPGQFIAAYTTTSDVTNNRQLMDIKIVSGGQTGVDRAALDAAMTNGKKTGGWCPQGRLAEDGRIPSRYSLMELANAGYKDRTIANVKDSDATVIIYFAVTEGGTRLTENVCRRIGKPYLLIDAEIVDFRRGAEKVAMFITLNSISTLNIAGPRASKETRGYDYTVELVNLLLSGNLLLQL